MASRAQQSKQAAMRRRPKSASGPDSATFESGKGDTIGAGRKVSARGLMANASPSNKGATVINKGRSESAAEVAREGNDEERSRNAHIKSEKAKNDAVRDDRSAGRSAIFAEHVSQIPTTGTAIAGVVAARRPGLSSQSAESAAGPAMGIPAAMPKDSTPSALKAAKGAADSAAADRTASSGRGSRAGLYDPNSASGSERATHQQTRQWNKNKRRRVRQVEKRAGLADQISAATDPSQKAALQAEHDSIKGHELYSKSEKTMARAIDRDEAAKYAKTTSSAQKGEEKKLSRQAEAAGISIADVQAKNAPRGVQVPTSSLPESRRTVTPGDITPGPEKELEAVHRHLGIPKPHIKTLISKKYPQLSVREGLSAMYSLRTNQTRHPETGKTPWETLHGEAQEHSASEASRQSAQGTKNARTSRTNKRQNAALVAHTAAEGAAKMAGEQFSTPRPVHPGVAASERKNDIAADRASAGPTSNQGARGPAFHAAAAFGGDVATPIKRGNFEEVSGPRPTVSVPKRPRKKAPKKDAE